MQTKCIYQRILPGSGALPKDRPAAGQLNLRFHSPVRCGTIHIARLLPPWMNLPPWRLRLHTAQPVIPAADGCAIVPLSIMDDGGEKDFWFPTRSLFCWDFLKMAQTLIAGWEEPIGLRFLLETDFIYTDSKIWKFPYTQRRMLLQILNSPDRKSWSGNLWQRPEWRNKGKRLRGRFFQISILLGFP